MTSYDMLLFVYSLKLAGALEFEMETIFKFTNGKLHI